MTHTQLYFDCVDRFIVTGTTPIKKSTVLLPKVKPIPFLDKEIRLTDFSAFYTTYIGSTVVYMVSTFFAARLFLEFASSQNKYLVVEMLEELLIICSTK